MKKIKIALILLCMSALLFLENCSKSSDPAPIPLKADAGAAQTVAPFTTVTLDASASTGPGTLTYQWMLLGSSVNISDVQFSDLGAVKPTFVPPKNGVYTFAVTVASSTQSQVSQAQVTITVTGALTLSGTLSSNLILKDIELDPAKPDYILSADLIIPTGVTVTAGGNITIDAADNTGIQIQGGSLVGPGTNGSIINFTSTPGWKGILLSSGVLTLNLGKIIKGGKSTFTGQSETAAITVTGGTLTLSANTFTSSTGYDLLMTSAAAGSTIISNTFSALKPIKAPIGYLPVISTNNYGTYDYIVLTTPGAGTNVFSSAGFNFLNGVKYYIDGDFSSSSSIFASSSTIYMKAGAGILASAGISLQSTTIDGYDGINFGAAWKGIAVGGNSNNTVTINTSFVKNAGSAVFNTGSFTTPLKAAIYYFASLNGTLNTTEISGSGGYGVVVDSPPGNYLNMGGNSFKNNTLAHISAPVTTINLIFAGAATTTNTFTGVATALEIPSFSAGTQPVGIWASLGSTNAYQFLSSVTHSSSIWTLSPGVNLKFKSNKQLDHTGGSLNAIGSAISPITFDSDAGTAASWIGIGLEASYDLEFCTIKNGGQSEVFKGGSTPATLKANVVFNSTTGTIIFKNNTLSGGGGYGTLIESGKLDPQPLLAGNSNTFTSNALGTSLKQP